MQNSDNLELIIAEGKKQYLCLLDDAAKLLRSLDTVSPKLLADAVLRRQESVEQLQFFDKRLDRLAPEGSAALVEFRTFQEEITGRILGVDGVLVALAREKQTAIVKKLASLTKSSVAFQAYGEKETIQRRWLSETM